MSDARESLARGGLGRGPIPRAILDVCREAGDSRALRADLRAELRRFVPFDAYCVNTCDPLTGVVTSSVGDGLSPRDAIRLFAIESGGRDLSLLIDLARRRSGPAILSRTTEGRVHRSRRMREIFLPLGLRDELRAPLIAGDHCWGYLHLFRAKGAFSESDAHRIALVTRGVALGLRRAAIAAPGLRRSPVEAPGIIVVDRQGRARVAAGGAGHAIRALDLDGHQPVPHGIYAAGHHATRAPSESLGAVVRGIDGDWISLHGLALAGRPAVIVDAASASRMIPLVLLACGLTARERQVASLLVGGASNLDISRDLGIGVFTVKDHVKRVFAKTRTSSRAALTAFAGTGSR